MLLDAANAIVRLLLSPPCAACDGPLPSPLESAVCATCWRGVQYVSTPLCRTCGDELLSGGADSRCGRCRTGPPRFVQARSAGRYDGSLRKIIHAFKYVRRRPLAAPLASLMRAAGRSVLDGADAVVPVPLHPFRMVRRGFNQADDLAVHLGPPVWRVLRRRRPGPPQADLPASERYQNVRQAFAVGWTPLRPMRRGRRLPPRTVVHEDDVMTTGATLDACSAALLDAGITEVRALTAARAVAARPGVPRERPHPVIARR